MVDLRVRVFDLRGTAACNQEEGSKRVQSNAFFHVRSSFGFCMSHPSVRLSTSIYAP